MKTLLLSSLTKVFKEKEPNFNELGSFSCLKNEKFSFQLGFMAENKNETKISVTVSSPLKDDLKISKGPSEEGIQAARSFSQVQPNLCARWHLP